MAEPAPRWETWLGTRARVRELRGLQRNDAPRGRVFDLASNDYLGLAGHRQVRRAAADAALEHGAGAGASRVAGGTFAVHRELEAGLCSYAHRQSALVFSSGYTANLGVLGALGGPGSLFIIDAHAHASLIDGAKLSASAVATAAHNDLEDVARLLHANREDPQGKPRVLVVVESLYSVFGDAAALPKLAALCAQYGALLLVDEAHSLGAVPWGSAVHAAGLAGASHVLSTATLSKALGSQGGAVLLGGSGAQALREQLVNASRTFIFDTGLSPVAAVAALAALRLATPERLAALQSNARLVFEQLRSYSHLADRVDAGAGAVHSVRMSSSAAAFRATAKLAAAGIAVACFRPPSVPDSISRLRLTAHAQHQGPELEIAIHTVARTIAEED